MANDIETASSDAPEGAAAGGSKNGEADAPESPSMQEMHEQLAQCAEELGAQNYEFDPARLPEFSKAFAEFFAIRFSKSYRKHAQAPQLGEDLLLAMGMTLVYREKLPDALDLARSYPDSAAASRFAQLCKQLRALKAARRAENADEAGRILRDILTDPLMADHVEVERCAVWRHSVENPPANPFELERYRLTLRYPKARESQKYLGDMYWSIGAYGQAMKCYRRAAQGNITKSAHRYIEGKGPFGGAAPDRATMSVMGLLSEIDALMSELGAPYVCAGPIPAILRDGVVTNFISAQVFVDARFMRKLARKLEKRTTAERGLETYPENESGSRFALRYSDRTITLLVDIGDGVSYLDCPGVDIVAAHDVFGSAVSFVKPNRYTRVLLRHTGKYRSRSLTTRDAQQPLTAAALPATVFEQSKRRGVLGVELNVPVDLDAFCAFLEQYASPRTKPAAVQACDVPIADICAQVGDIAQVFDRINADSLAIAERQARIRQRHPVVDDVWSFAKSLYENDEDWGK